jgi:hypothetical protein
MTTQLPHPLIRPSPDHLKSLPTLRVLTPETDGPAIRKRCRARGCDFRLELKWQTERARFWLITRCVGEPFTDWKEGNVLVENIEPDDAAEREMVPYGSADLKRLQRIDYFWMLRAEFERLLEEPWSWEREKRLEELRMEMQEVACAIVSADRNPLSLSGEGSARRR